jgi:type IV pilus assembly protein PilW
MVGLLIGMLSVILIMQVFATSEGNKRTTTGGNDAQINGNIALYGLERDIRDAGYGLNSFNVLGCSLSYTTSGDTAGVTLTSLAPVSINPPAAQVPAGDPNTDTLLVVFANPNGPAEGDLINTAPSTGSYPVTTPAAFIVNDLVIALPAARPSPCALTLGKVTAKNASTLTVNPGDATGLTLGSVVFNLGQTLTVRAYAVRQGNLTVCDYAVNNCGSAAYAAPLNSNVWVPVATNIVSLRAQYGRDISGIAASQMTGVVGTFDQKTPGTAADTSGLAVQCGWARTLAIRLALVARSPQYDKDRVTQNAPTWAGTPVLTTSPTNPTALTITLSNDSDWEHYRYKTLQTTVPIRNVVWQGSQTTLEGGSGAC